MSLVIPDEILTSSHFSEAELLREIVLMFFKEKRITIGKASSLLRMHLIEFQQFISSRNICIHYEIEDLDADFRTLTG
jgi:predicted HTH domain antitoxin